MKLADTYGKIKSDHNPECTHPSCGVVTSYQNLQEEIEQLKSINAKLQDDNAALASSDSNRAIQDSMKVREELEYYKKQYDEIRKKNTELALDTEKYKRIANEEKKKADEAMTYSEADEKIKSQMETIRRNRIELQKLDKELDLTRDSIKFLEDKQRDLLEVIEIDQKIWIEKKKQQMGMPHQNITAKHYDPVIIKDKEPKPNRFAKLLKRFKR